MSRYVSFGKRVLAMVLVLVLVLSYIPAGTFALATEQVEAMTAVITREGDAAPYTYTLKVTKTVGGTENEVVPSSVIWADGVQSTVVGIGTDATYESSAETVTAQFTYGMLSGVVAYESATANTIAYSAAEDAAWANKTVYVGEPVTAPETKENGGITGAQTETTVNEENMDEVDGKYIPKKVSDTPIHLLTQKLYNGLDIMEAREYSAKVAYNLENVAFKIGDKQVNGTAWVNTASTVTVLVTDRQVISSDYLPAIKVGDAEQSVTWTGEGTEANPWTATVTVSTDSTVSMLDRSVTVKLDDTAPVISDGVGYVDSEGNTYISFAYDSNVSSTDKVYVDGQEVGGVNAGRHTTTLTGAKEEVVVEVHDLAGNVSQETIAVQPQLKAEIAASEAVNSVENTYYYNRDKQLTLTVDIAGTTEDGDYDVVSIIGAANGGAVALTIENEKNAEGKYVCTYTGPDISLSDITVTVTDEKGRTATQVLAGTYVYDTTAPTLVLTVSAESKTAGMLRNEDKVYVGVTETGSAVKFLINGTVVDENCDKTFSKEQLCENDKVTTITLEDTVVDLAGNPLTSVTVMVNEEQKTNVLCQNGMFSLDLLADLQKPYSDEASLKINITDGNGDAISADKFYNENELIFKAQIEDGDGIGINEVMYTIDGVTTSEQAAAFENGEYLFDMSSFLEDTETSVKLIVTAVDKLNNSNCVEVLFNVDTVAPEATVTVPVTANNTVETLEFYKTEQEVVITVTDSNFDAVNSVVSYKINGEEKPGVWAENVCTIAIADGETFSDLAYTVKDKAGHQITGSDDAYFCVDTTVPVIEITMPTEPAQTVEGVDYYNAEQIVTVKVTDVNFDSTNSVVSYKINGEEEVGTWAENVCTIAIADGETFSDLKVVAKDYATNQADKEETAVICVDTTVPAIEITMPTEPAQTVEGVDYYNAKQTVTITVSDANIDMASCAVSYKINGEEKVGTWAENVCTIEIANGQTFSDLKVVAKDYATNQAEKEETAVICVDTIDPTVKVTKTVEEGKAHQIINANNDYYNGTVTYKVEIADTNLQVSTLSYMLQGDEKETTVDVVGSYELVLTNGMMLTDMVIVAKDKATNKAETVEVVDADGYTPFDGVTYDGRDVIVDATVPTATLDISGEGVANCFVINGIVFVDFKESVKGASGEQITDKETVTLTVTAADKNLSLHENNSGFYVRDNADTDAIAWDGNPAANTDSTVTYVKEIEVEADSTGLLEFDLSIVDLAGNILGQIDAVTVNGVEASSEVKEQLQGAVNGTVKNKLAIDRRRPTSGEDAVAPFIKVTTDLAPTVSNNGLDLFSGAFKFTLQVTDGQDIPQNSGLASITYEIVDDNGVVKESTMTYDQDLTLNETVEIPVELLQVGETNDAVLNITVIDKAGNVITYSKEFAVDNKASVVTVEKTGSNWVNTVTGEENKAIDLYAGAVSYIVTVEDINLTDAVLTYAIEGKDETTVRVTQNQWTQDGNKYSHEIQLADGDVLNNITIQAIDNADNKAAVINVTDAESKTSFTYDAQTNVHTYTGNYVAVDMTAPAVTVYKSVEDEKRFVRTVEESAGMIDLYDGMVTYTVYVTDNFLTAENAAVAVVRYKLEGDAEWRTVDLFGNAVSSNNILSNNTDCFQGTFTIEDGQVLQALEVEVKDNVGNETQNINSQDSLTPFDGMNYTGNYVAVDKTAPVVTVTKTGSCVQSIDVDTTEQTQNMDFYAGQVTYTVQVKDQFLVKGNGATALVRYKLENAEWEELDLFNGGEAANSILSNNEDVYEVSFTLEDGDTLTAFEIEVVDNAGNKPAAITVGDSDNKTGFAYNAEDNVHTYTGNPVRVDMTAPVITVTKSVEENKQFIQSSEKTDYYNGEVTYTFAVSDRNLTNASGQVQQLNLTYQFEGKDATVIALPAEGGWEKANDADSYTYSFTVADGMVLESLSIQVVDNAGNFAEAVDVTDNDALTSFATAENYDATGNWNYSARKVAVDKTAPAVTVEKTGSYTQTVEGYDYYNTAISYKVTVQDAFLNQLDKSVAQVVVTYMDATKTQTVNLLSSAAYGENEGDLDSYDAIFDVADGDAIVDIQVIVIDNAGNIAKEVGVTDTDERTSFEYVEETNTLDYTGNIAVADTTAPTAKVEITGEIVDSFYTYDGVTYVKLKNPGKAASGALTGQADETVTLTVTVSDKNLTLDTENLYGVKNNLDDNIVWMGEPAVNADSTVTYTKNVTVPADSTGIIEFSLTAFDLAGNAIGEVKVADINDTDSTKINAQVQPENGVFGTTISLDRRRPSSIADGNAPVIQIKPSISNTTSNNGLELFNKAFTFALDVTDGEKNAHNSGIDTVQWIVEDQIGFVQYDDTTNDLEDGVYSQSFTIPVSLTTPIGESNSVKITIIATDNVGNVTEYIKEFAVDTQKPVVVVSYDNNDVMNDKYFKADRKVTITVSDINFEPATTTITTQVDSTGWSKNGDVYTTTCTYNVDGIYTLDMATTDRANNTADIDFTNNNTNAAPTDFVLDKTAPIIEVAYNPANPVDRDGSGVHYFDKNRQLTVTITEVNFDPANQNTKLVANLGANNALSAWTSNGDVHTATETFTEGNNYQVKIDYTDLAGNPATGYSSETFSVDLGKPTIRITSGELTNESFNVVQNDLVLGFTINDQQNNLKNFNATLLFLDKEFKQQEVTGSAYYTVAGKSNRTTGTVTFANIAKEKINDGIYTVQITAEDYAGHKVELEPQLVFSLNRFGSTFYAEDEATRQFLTAAADGNVYQNRASSLKIIERNPNRVYQAADSKEEGSLITISVNGNSTQLQKGVDYLVDIQERGAGSNKWMEYTYEILASNFFDGDTQIDGRYEILFYSVDTAGNSNTNETNEDSSIQADAQGNYSGKISFTLDNKAPVLSILDLKEKGGTTFDAAFKRIPISVSDNTPCTIEVYIDDVLVELKEALEGLADNENWLAPDGQGGYILNISASDAPQDVRVVVKDAAGNEIEQYRQRVLVSDSFWVRYINNYWAVGGTIAGLVAVVFIIILLVKKRKKEEQ